VIIIEVFSEILLYSASTTFILLIGITFTELTSLYQIINTMTSINAI